LSLVGLWPISCLVNDMTSLGFFFFNDFLMKMWPSPFGSLSLKKRDHGGQQWLCYYFFYSISSLWLSVAWPISFVRICWTEALYGGNASWWMEIRSERKDLREQNSWQRKLSILWKLVLLWVFMFFARQSLHPNFTFCCVNSFLWSRRVE
jgi:hypothetical protein